MILFLRTIYDVRTIFDKIYSIETLYKQYSIQKLTNKTELK